MYGTYDTKLQFNLMIEFFFNGNEYTTRARLQDKYSIAHTTLQELLEDEKLLKIEDGNKFYFLKSQAELIVATYIQKQLISSAAMKQNISLAPKLEYRKFKDYPN